MLTIWCVILVPWLFFTSMASGIAVEDRNTFSAYVFVAIAWTYQALVVVSFFFRRRRPKLIWLPMLPLIAMFVGAVI